MTFVLAITGVGVPPYSVRGATQTLEPIDASGSMRRTVNGTLLDLSAAQFHKYKSVIACTDQQPPSVDGVWPGKLVTVDCIAELGYVTLGGSPGKSVVSGSSRTDGLYTFYRPQLSMRVVTFNVNHDEFGAAVNWQMSLEEN